MKKVNQSLLRKILPLVKESFECDEMLGFCLACGAQSEDCCEPDARNYHCPECGEDMVFGAEEILIQAL